jgi:hypothetical protein
LSFLKANDAVRESNMGCIFSVEIESKQHVRNISISDEAHDRVLFEGDLGALSEVSIIESCALEIVGANGVLRIELDAETLLRVFESPNRTFSLGSEVGSHKSTKKREGQ